MTPAMIEPSAVHRAALSLHGLAAADRDWVLQALTPEQRGTLQPLLAELQELGIPADAALFDAAAQLPEAAGAGGDALLFLAPADVERLAGMLAAEPPRLAAALLAAGGWPWRDHLLRAMPGGFAHAVRQAGAAVAEAPLLQAAVVEQVRVRLAQQPAEAPGRFEASLLRRALRLLRRRQ